MHKFWKDLILQYRNVVFVLVISQCTLPSFTRECFNNTQGSDTTLNLHKYTNALIHKSMNVKFSTLLLLFVTDMYSWDFVLLSEIKKQTKQTLCRVQNRMINTGMPIMRRRLIMNIMEKKVKSMFAGTQNKGGKLATM